MKCLIVIPHIFKPIKGSLYSSQTESKRLSKTKALNEATIGNLNRHNNQHWIHASLGNRKRITTRRLEKKDGIEMIDHTPREGLNNTLVAFAHPKSLNGVLIELAQKI